MPGIRLVEEKSRARPLPVSADLPESSGNILAFIDADSMVCRRSGLPHQQFSGSQTRLFKRAVPLYRSA